MSIPSAIAAIAANLLKRAAPTDAEQQIIIQSHLATNVVLQTAFGSETYLIGSVVNNVQVPNEFVETTQFLSSKDSKQWAVQANHAISQSSRITSDGRFGDSNIEIVQMSVKCGVVHSYQKRVRSTLSVNNIHGLFLSAIIEMLNNVIGKDNLFKRSLMLIKLWVLNETRRFTHLDISDLFGHNALTVMVMMMFATRNIAQENDIDNPVAALTCFLEIFSEMDWNSFHVTATEILPNHSFDSYLKANESDSSIKKDLISIIEHYRRFFAENFLFEDGRNSIDGVHGGHNTLERSVVMVMDPFEPGKNLCRGCSSAFCKPNTSDLLRWIFARGLQELSELLVPLLDGGELSILTDQEIHGIQNKFISTVFPITDSMFFSREEDMPGDQQSSFKFPFVDINARFDDEHFRKTLQEIENIILRAVQLVSKTVTEDAIINLIVQTLHQHGPLPLGEIGKQLQTMTQNAEFPKILKKRFGGLKKFIASHPDRFCCGDNHSFNPVVFVTGENSARPIGAPATGPASNLNSSQEAALAALTSAVKDLPLDVIRDALSQSTTAPSASFPPFPRSITPVSQNIFRISDQYQQHQHNVFRQVDASLHLPHPPNPAPSQPVLNHFTYPSADRLSNYGMPQSSFP